MTEVLYFLVYWLINNNVNSSSQLYGNIHEINNERILLNIILTRLSEKSKFIRQEIYKLFVRECSNISYLDLWEVRHPIYQFSGVEICLLNLNEVDCKSCLETSLFYGIAHICKLIEKIYIEFNYDNIGLAKLIKTQKQIQ
ncbi:hypothetical protein RhiirC2_852278 [Rhizophagus irregularis]|uniref:Uncharacterized protein n=1 Tax=Rhizophagus irregularis TaxID=588596 RepID=A0A2N1N045_9GLOM|nr:hypothetical protein RhiirC2_852278 [Rhizophagus irregularis]